MEDGSPYRDQAKPPRYLCIVCYQTASATEGSCARCGNVPLQQIADNADILGELRRRAKAKKDRPERVQFIMIAVGAAVCALILDGILLGTGAYDVKPPAHAGYSGRWGAGGELFFYPFLMWLGFILLLTYVFKWTGAFRRSIQAAERFNPDAADAGELLAWLGVRVDG